MHTTPWLLRFNQRTIAALVLSTAFGTSMWAAAPDAGADAKKKQPAGAAQSEPSPVFTNKSLDNLPPPPPPTALDHLSSAPAPSPASPGPDGSGVITNETLEKLFGPSTPPPAPPAASAQPSTAPAAGAAPGAPKSDAAPVDPLTAIQLEKAEEAKRQQALADAQHDLATAEEKVREMEQRLLSQRNPYLPPPKLSPDEQAKVAGLDGAARVQRTQQELDLAKKELERAKAQVAQSEPKR